MNRIEIMKNEKVPKALMKLGLPAIIGMLINAIYNVADTFFVAGISTEAIGGASVAFPLTMIVVGVGGIFGHGAASYISRLLGQEKRGEANNTAVSSCIYSLLLSFILMAIVFAFIESILRVLGATDAIMPYAKDYTYIYMLGAPFAVMSINLNNLARAEGAAKMSMIALMCGSLLNIALDPLFIYTFNLGIKGAAIATVIAQVFTTVFLTIFFLSKKSYLKISFRNHRYSKTEMTEMLKIGIPTFAFQLLTSFAIGLTNYKAAGFGNESIAAIGIVTKLMSIGLYFVFGYTKGFQPFAGYNYGAGKIDRVKRAIRFSLKLTTIFCVIISVGFITFSSNIIGLFSDSDLVISIGSRGLVANSIFFVTFGFQMVYVTLFLALGKGKEGGILSLLRQGICLIPVLLLLPTLIGLDGVLFAQGIADVLTTIITAAFVFKFYKDINAEEDVKACADTEEIPA